MKKTLLLTILVSMQAFSAITGTKDSGFSFGGEALLEITPLKTDKILEKAQGNIWAKYELPKMKNIKSYVKGSFVRTDKNLLTLEADGNYSYKDYTLGLNFKTEIPVFNEKGKNEVLSSHTISISKGKLLGLSDVKASTTLMHSYTKNAFKGVEVKAQAKYEEVENLNIKALIEAKYHQFINEEYKTIEGLRIINSDKITLLDTYKLIVEYKGVKDLVLTGIGEIKHFLILPVGDAVEYGLDLKADYTPIKNLTLTANGLFYGQHEAAGEIQVGNILVSPKKNNGYVKLLLGSKYEYKINDKFTLTPEGTISYNASNIDFVPAKAFSTILLTPKVLAKFKVAENFTLDASIEAPIKFSNEDKTVQIEESYNKKFEYKGTELKASLNLKYAW